MEGESLGFDDGPREEEGFIEGCLLCSPEIVGRDDGCSLGQDDDVGRPVTITEGFIGACSFP